MLNSVRVPEPCPGADEDESAAKYLFKLSRDVILSLDRSGNILCINRRGVQLSGYSETELRGANISERLLLPEDRTAVDQILYDLVQGKTREYEVRWRTKDGAIVHFDGVSVPRLSENGEFLSTLCTLRDITERKSAEEKLRKSEEKYRDLIEISPDAIYVVDANGVCVLGNRAGAELAGIPENELVGTPVTETYLPEERQLFRERLEKLKTGGTLRYERNVRAKERRKGSRGSFCDCDTRRIFPGNPARHQQTQARRSFACRGETAPRDGGEGRFTLHLFSMPYAVWSKNCAAGACVRSFYWIRVANGSGMVQDRAFQNHTLKQSMASSSDQTWVRADRPPIVQSK